MATNSTYPDTFDVPTIEALGPGELGTSLEYTIAQFITEANLDVKSILKHFSAKSELQDKSREFLVLETFIIRHQCNIDDLRAICLLVQEELAVSDQNDWTSVVPGSSKEEYSESSKFYALRATLAILRTQIIEDTIFLDLVEVCSYYSNPWVPWSSKILSKVASSITDYEGISLRVVANFDAFMIRVAPNLLKLPNIKPRHSSLANANNANRLHGGLKPRLGYGGAKKEILEEDARRSWKNSSRVKCLSMVWFIIAIMDEILFEIHWSMVTSFLLNLNDDHEPLIKYQCMKIEHFFLSKVGSFGHAQHILKKSGLLDVFIESNKKALSHTPPITPPSQSLLVLREAYSCVKQLLAVKEASQSVVLEYTELVTIYILPSISNLLSRSEKDSFLPVIILLLEELKSLISGCLSFRVMISISRITFVLNQTITNPFILDHKFGIQAVRRCLECQEAVIDQIADTDSQGKELLLAYRYDFVGSWTVLAKRFKKMDAPKESLVTSNLDKLQALGGNWDDISDVLATLREV